MRSIRASGSGVGRGALSGPNDNCVEVGRLGACAAVRDTKDREGGYVTANATQWTTFLDAVKSDRFTNHDSR